MDMFQLKDSISKQSLKNDLKIHLNRQRTEREDYYRKRGEACKKPSEAMNIIIDGMDQAKTNLPHFKGWTRPKCGAPALKTHITGALVHGRKCNFYIDLLQWPHCPNLTISCLVRSICETNNATLPPILYLQCDNCGRENKNRYVIGFLGYLCLAGYVKEAHLSFLIKGHTHEDIDQRFSKISHRLRENHAMTLPKLKIEVEKSFVSAPNVEILSCVWEVKSWLDGVLNELSNHSYQHQFWLYCDRPKHVTLRYRRFSTDPWLPDLDADNQVEIFDLDSSGDHRYPLGSPQYSPPCFEDSRMELVKSSITKMKTFLSFDENKWWNDFLKNQNKAVRKNMRWPLLNVNKQYRLVSIPPSTND